MEKYPKIFEKEGEIKLSSKYNIVSEGSRQRYFMKETTYRKEEMFLSPYACKSADTKGRRRAEEPCPMRTDFQRDRDRIIHSKSFRRLKNKTQVFLSPEGDHYRTRLTHTLDVSQIARSIARSLDLNEDLTEAISLGHDLGHTPFGHEGERALNSLSGGHFRHNEQSLRVVDVLENLNLTQEVRDGILNHQTSGNPSTLEGKAVCLADKIAYVNHDIDDALRAGILRIEEIPKALLEVLGRTSRERINNMISSIYRASRGQPQVKMEPEFFDATYRMRDFLFERVYFDNAAKDEEKKARLMIETLFGHLDKHPELLPEFYRGLLERDGKTTVLCDFISSMSDRYAVHFFESIFVPSSWKLDSHI